MDASRDTSPLLGEYAVERELGRGGMGVVLLARHRRLGRLAAVKVIAPHLSSDPVFRARFERESRVAAGLDHPNIVPIYEAGELDGRLFIAMRYVDGTDLRALVATEGRLPPDRVLRIVTGIAGALDAAHDHGLVHRDVKPSNVLVSSSPPDHPYVADFGITSVDEGTTTLTADGAMVGSVAYVAPEAIRGEAVDGRADVYSLGCLTYELLTGRPPFRRESDAATLGAHLHGDPPPVSSLGVPVALDAPLARALAKDPRDRWARAGDFAQALAAALGHTPTTPHVRRPVPRRPRALRPLLLTAAAALAAAALGAFAGWHLDRTGRAEAQPGAQSFASAYWGVRFRFPPGWGLRALAPPGIAAAGAGDVFCNLFDDARARAPRGNAALLDFGRRQARALERRGGFDLRALDAEQIDGRPAVGYVGVDRITGRPSADRMLEVFRPGGAVRVECSAPPARFAAVDRRAFRPLLASLRFGARAG